MSRIAKRAGIEALWLFGGCAFGAWIWIHVASYYEARVDAYWTTKIRHRSQITPLQPTS